MNDPTESHYIARLVVEKVEHVRKPGNPQSQRQVQEMGSFTVKDGDLGKLLSKVSAHASLIGD